MEAKQICNILRLLPQGTSLYHSRLHSFKETLYRVDGNKYCLTEFWGSSTERYEFDPKKWTYFNLLPNKKQNWDSLVVLTKLKDSDYVSFSMREHEYLGIVSSVEKNKLNLYALIDLRSHRVFANTCCTLTDASGKIVINRISFATNADKKLIDNYLLINCLNINTNKKCVFGANDKKLFFNETVLAKGDGMLSAWDIEVFYHFYVSDNNVRYVCSRGIYSSCIPYKGNEDLLGTTIEMK